MTAKLDTLQAALRTELGDRIRKLVRDRGEITVTVGADDYLGVARTLRDHPALRFEQLIDLCGVDYSSYRNQPWDGPRYCVVLHLLSVTHNWRVRLKVFAPDDEMPVVASVTEIWSAPTGSSARPSTCTASSSRATSTCAASSPTTASSATRCARTSRSTGHVEMRYDAETKRVIYQPVTIEPREIMPRVVREDKYGGLH